MRAFFLLTFFVVQSFSLWALQADQQLTTYTKEDCQQLIDEASEEANNKNYPEALELLLKAELMASKNHWDDKLWGVKLRIGIIYAYISNFGEALDYFQESYAVTQKDKSLYEYSSVPLSSIGVLYVSDKKYEEALHYMLRAYENIKESGYDYSFQKLTASNIASIYNKLNKPHKSLEILFEAEGSCGNAEIDFKWQVTYIDVLLKSGEVFKAQTMAEQLYTELNSGTYTDYREECYTCLVILLSDIYTTIKEIDLAIEFAEKGLKHSDELINHIELYENISNLYLQKDEHRIALQYKDSVIKTKDSLASLMNRNLYEANKVKFKVSEFQNELNAKKQQQQAERKLFTMAVIFGLIILFSIYKILKNRVIKQKQDGLLKQEQLKNDIARKNRELSAKALHLTNRNELIKEIINSLEANNKIAQNKETAQQIKTIKNFLKTDRHQEDFIKHFENVNPVLLKKLKEQYPKLTAEDVRFICYIFMNLSLKEISIVYNITYDACRIRRNRIMEKMKLDKTKTSLYDQLLEMAE